MNVLIKKKRTIIIFIFFAMYLCIGLTVFKDYGLSWDCPGNRMIGEVSLEYVLHDNQDIFEHEDRHYGPAFEMIPYTFELIFNIKDSRKIFLMRHLVNFLFFYIGVIFFYKLCLYHFRNWKLALLGCILLVLSPRIFADSFYNSVDITFLVMFIISIYTLFLLLDKKTLLFTIIHALSCAILIDIRIFGILVPFLTAMMLITALASAERKNKKIEIAVIICLYIFLLVFFVVLFWPALWEDPFSYFYEFFIQMISYVVPIPGVLYFGKYISVDSLPWHYALVWIGITTPLLYLIFFASGCIFLAKKLLRHPFTILTKERNNSIFLIWCFLPLVLAIVLKVALYDGWRHLFFIYPAFLIISLTGLKFIFQVLQQRLNKTTYRILNNIFITAIFLLQLYY